MDIKVHSYMSWDIGKYNGKSLLVITARGKNDKKIAMFSSFVTNIEKIAYTELVREFCNDYNLGLIWVNNPYRSSKQTFSNVCISKKRYKYRHTNIYKFISSIKNEIAPDSEQQELNL